MYDYFTIHTTIQDKLDSGEITYENAVLMNDLAYERYITSYNELYSEDAKEVLNKGKEKIINTSNKIGKSYVDSANKRGEKVAKMLIKKPGPNSPASVVKRYEDKVNKVKAGYKVGEILAINLVLLTLPFTNLPFNAGVAVGLNKSNDPSDKKTQEMINKIKSYKDNVKNIYSKLKGKVVTAKDDIEIKRLESDGMKLANEVDKNISNNKLTTESQNDYSKLEEETRNSDKALLNQYKKELKDLREGTGIAKTMSRQEKNYAIRRLEFSIKDLTKVLSKS